MMGDREERRRILAINEPIQNGYRSIETGDEKVELPDVDEGKTSTPAAVFIVVNAAMGAGLLNFPNAFGQAGGIGPGVAMELMFLILIVTSLFALAYCSQLHSSNTYQSAIEATCGKGFGIATEICIIVYMFGTCIAMVIIIGDQFDKVMEAIVGIDFCHHWYMNRKFTMSAFAILIILPLCIPKDIGFLRHASVIGVIATLVVMFTVVIKYFTEDHHPVHNPRGKDSWGMTFSAIPAIFFAYQCHVSSVPVYATLKRKTMSNWSIVIVSSMVLCATTYTVTGVFGYLTFGDAAKSDILQSYDAKDWFVIAARISVVVAMITSYPILQFCGRAALITLLSKTGMTTLTPPPKREKIRRYVITMTWFFSSLAFSLLVPNIGVAIAVVGGIAGCFILVFPGFALTRIILDDTSPKTRKSYFLMGVGMLLFVGGMFLFGEITCRAIIDDVRDTDPELSSKCYES
uniref:putative sodium-coupled neutral amino acid transporter 7 n=1 Tax=Styela clava TaxID=7725 RepID=UPI001939487F|nr:putative sodium-coupled neutral amino acid transporter 7 [Styela clava]